jgi:hypothetical protein
MRATDVVCCAAPADAEEEPDGATEEAAAEQLATVLWLDVKPPRGQEGPTGSLPRSGLIRKQEPLSEALLRGWLRANAQAENFDNVKGIPAIWRAAPEQCARYGLPTALPKSLVSCPCLHPSCLHL